MCEIELYLGGLEVFHRELKQWVQVKIPSEHKSTALIINAGDLMHRWTRGVWHSPLHRVRAPGIGRTNTPCASRLSAVFFSGPRSDVLVQPLPLGVHIHSRSSCTDAVDDSLYAPILAGDYLQSKIGPTAIPIEDI